MFDHTSSLQFLETFLKHKTGKTIKEENISDWRRTVCGDLTSVFRPFDGDKTTDPEFLPKDAFLESIHKAKFKQLPPYQQLNEKDIALIKTNRLASQHMPQQEKGIKPSSALNYELYADGKLSADKKNFTINFKAGTKTFGKQSLGSPFNVYAPGKYAGFNEPGKLEDVRTWSYALTPGDSLADEWALHEFGDDGYHLRVYGPNGFYREYKGTADDPAIDVHCGYHEANNRPTGNIELVITNPGNHHHQVSITDNAYKGQPHLLQVTGTKHLALNLQQSHGWYDFSVKIKGYPQFEKRYAGRVETGRHSFTDPLMGGVV